MNAKLCYLCISIVKILNIYTMLSCTHLILFSSIYPFTQCLSLPIYQGVHITYFISTAGQTLFSFTGNGTKLGVIH